MGVIPCAFWVQGVSPKVSENKLLRTERIFFKKKSYLTQPPANLHRDGGR